MQQSDKKNAINLLLITILIAAIFILGFNIGFHFLG